MKLFTEQGKIAAFYSILFYFLVGALFFCKYYFFFAKFELSSKNSGKFYYKDMGKKEVTRPQTRKVGELDLYN